MSGSTVPDSSPARPYPAAPPRILLAAGGTGGHIYPAVALAEALREASPGVQIHFCCGNRPAEWQIYRRLGIEPWVLPIAHHRRGLRQRMQFARQMIAAWREARRRLRAEPVQAAVGFGGYISVPPLLAARRGGARLALHEQNARPGLANRLLARLCALVATGMPVAGGVFPAGRTHHVGNPVRAQLLKPPPREEARAFFRLGADRPICLVVGGSQGALGLNRLIINVLCRLKEVESEAAGWSFLWSTGPPHFDFVNRTLREMGIDPAELSVNPYIDEMARAYAAADVVVARAGALTLAELTALGRPAVLVPLPTSAGGHQLSNARALMEAGAAELIEETDPQGAEKLESLLAQWAAHPDTLVGMGRASAALGRPDAARELARLVLELLPNLPRMS